MDDLYSLSLLVSLLTGALSALIALSSLPAVGARLPESLRLVRALRRMVRPILFVAFAALLVSVVTHLVWGHRPGTPEALPPRDFLMIHPSFVVAALLPVISAVLLWRTGKNTRRTDEGGGV